MLSHSATKPSLPVSTVTSNRIVVPSASGALALQHHETLRLGVDAVNYTDNDRAKRGVFILHDLAGGIAFVDDQHAFADAHAHAAVNGDEIAAGFACEIFLLNDHHLLPVIERVIDRRDDVTSDSADNHGLHSRCRPRPLTRRRPTPPEGRRPTTP